MLLFSLACDQGDPQGCDGAARLYEASGVTDKGKALRERAELLCKPRP
jgi:hypothetical protein